MPILQLERVEFKTLYSNTYTLNHLIQTLTLKTLTMKSILKRIDGKLIKVRPLPQLTDHSPLVMPFIGDPVSVFTRAKNTMTHIFTTKRCNNTVLIGDVTPHNGKWSWYSATIANANPILQSTIN